MEILKFILSGVLNFLELAIFARVILSWVRLPDDNPLVKIVYQVTEPILAPIRALVDRVLSNNRGIPLDFSPIIAFLLIYIINSAIDSAL